MQYLYDYLTGNEFRHRIESIRDAFSQMSHDLQKERVKALANFATREKQIQGDGEYGGAPPAPPRKKILVSFIGNSLVDL